MMRTILKMTIFLASCVLLAGCAAALIGGGAAGGYYTAKNKEEVSAYTSDSWITSKIKSKYLAESGLRSFKISVSTNNGVVSLVGRVSNKRQRDKAIHVAQDTKGVRKVDASQLRISP